MSSESTPILCGAIPAFEMFMTAWENCAEGHPNLKKYIQPGLDWACMYYSRMDRTRAYVIAMRKCFWSSCPEIVGLIVMCSPKPRGAYDMGRAPLGAGLHRLGQGKGLRYGEFIYLG
jgi:hypothetical protein